MSQDTERLSDEIVDAWASIQYDKDVRRLAREVQASRKLIADLQALVDDYHFVSSALLADTIEQSGLS